MVAASKTKAWFHISQRTDSSSVADTITTPEITKVVRDFGDACFTVIAKSNTDAAKTAAVKENMG